MDNKKGLLKREKIIYPILVVLLLSVSVFFYITMMMLDLMTISEREPFSSMEFYDSRLTNQSDSEGPIYSYLLIEIHKPIPIFPDKERDLDFYPLDVDASLPSFMDKSIGNYIARGYYNDNDYSLVYRERGQVRRAIGDLDQSGKITFMVESLSGERHLVVFQTFFAVESGN